MPAHVRVSAALTLLLLSGCRNADADRGAVSGAPLAVADSPDIGRYLVDARGRALWVSSADSKDASTCYEACSTDWPPVASPDPPVESSEPAIQGELVGTMLRRDGGRQLTYAGHPLYYRHTAEDRPLEPAVTDRWGAWSLVFPHGQPMQAPP